MKNEEIKKREQEDKVKKEAQQRLKEREEEIKEMDSRETEKSRVKCTVQKSADGALESD